MKINFFILVLGFCLLFFNVSGSPPTDKETNEPQSLEFNDFIEKKLIEKETKITPSKVKFANDFFINDSLSLDTLNYLLLFYDYLAELKEPTRKARDGIRRKVKIKYKNKTKTNAIRKEKQKFLLKIKSYRRGRDALVIRSKVLTE